MLARPTLARAWRARGPGSPCFRPRLVVTSAVASATPARPPARAVRPTPLKLIHVSKPDATVDALVAEWATKVRRYAPLEDVSIRPNPGRAADPAAAVASEGARVLKALGPSDVVVALDERGKEATSASIADLLAAAGGAGAGASSALEVRGGPSASLVFLVGGPFGHAPAVRARADATLRLSGCVLNHAIARVVLVEQLYRGWTILRGEPYHH